MLAPGARTEDPRCQGEAPKPKRDANRGVVFQEARDREGALSRTSEPSRSRDSQDSTRWVRGDDGNRAQWLWSGRDPVREGTPAVHLRGEPWRRRFARDRAALQLARAHEPG